MTSLGLSHYALAIGAAAALLAGCGGSQPPIGALGAMPQSRSTLQQRTDGDLLYISDSASDVYMYTYPGGEKAGRIKVDTNGSLCSDKNGNVFFTDLRSQAVYKYAHGGTTPISTLFPNASPKACSIDPKSGDLATVNDDSDNQSSISIFKKATGKPKKYFDVGAALGLSCSYDDKGNLYVTAGTQANGFFIAELPEGSHSFKNISVNAPLRGGNFLQWDSKYIAVTNAAAQKPIQVLQLSVSGSTGTVVHTTKLQGSIAYFKYFWIQNDNIITPRNGSGWQARKISFWKYPTGGKAFMTIALPKANGGFAQGITVSVAPR